MRTDSAIGYDPTIPKIVVVLEKGGALGKIRQFNTCSYIGMSSQRQYCLKCYSSMTSFRHHNKDDKCRADTRVFLFNHSEQNFTIVKFQCQSRK